MRTGSAIAVEKRLAAPPVAPDGAPVLIQGLEPFRQTLLAWYERNRRDLPWRKTRDPYSIWLSEIMLQQTRVAAVLGHYRVFRERFPHVQALAAASEDVVLAAWSGLGYYRRARMLHQCAHQVVGQHGGCFPTNSKALSALPGIGRYTAAAIASIAFSEPIAVVDGNVERVLQRLAGINLTTPQIWQHAQALLAEAQPGHFNQAMMELGATVCVPRAPRCPACPIRKWCVTRGEIPRAKPLLRQSKKQIWCALDLRKGTGVGGSKIRLVQRPEESSLMPGMWELPQWPEPPRPLPIDAYWRTFRHSITVTSYTVHVLRNLSFHGAVRQHASAPKRGATRLPGESARTKWVPVDHIPQLPITGLTRKILKAGGII